MRKTGDDYFDSNEFKEILLQYEESVKAGDNIFMDADDLTDIADYYSFIGEHEAASNAIDYALELHPNATLPIIFKAREALMSCNYEKAEEWLEEVEDKDDPDYHYTKAEILIAQDKVNEADNYLREYFMTVPPDEWQDFIMDVANIYNDYGLSDKAYEWIMRSKGDGSNDFNELMARTLFGLGKYKDSERIFNELLDRDPYSIRYWNALANAQFMNEDYSNAIASSEYAIAIDPEDAESVLTKANGLFRLNNYEEALKYYERYTHLQPYDEFGELHAGTCLVNMNKFEDALPYLTYARSISSRDSQYYIQIMQELAFTYSALHRLDDAINCLDEIDSLECDHIDLLVLRGHIFLENGRIDKAEDMFKEAIIQSDSSPTILLRIMVSLYDNKYVKAAYEMYRKFYRFYGHNFNEGHAYMALCCWDLGKVEEFMFYLKKAVDNNPKEAQNVLSTLFPTDMQVSEYYDYMTERLKRQ